MIVCFIGFFSFCCFNDCGIGLGIGFGHILKRYFAWLPLNWILPLKWLPLDVSWAFLLATPYISVLFIKIWFLGFILGISAIKFCYKRVSSIFWFFRFCYTVLWWLLKFGRSNWRFPQFLRCFNTSSGWLLLLRHLGLWLLFLRFVAYLALWCHHRLLALCVLNNLFDFHFLNLSLPIGPDSIVTGGHHLFFDLIEVTKCTFNFKDTQIVLKLIKCKFPPEVLLNKCSCVVLNLLLQLRIILHPDLVILPLPLNFQSCLRSNLLDKNKPPLTLKPAPKWLNSDGSNLLFILKHLLSYENFNSSAIKAF